MAHNFLSNYSELQLILNYEMLCFLLLSPRKNSNVALQPVRTCRKQESSIS